MPVVIQNSNYSGEVLEELLTVATTGNELVKRGLIRMQPGILKDFSLPRIKTSEMLQKVKENPVGTDAKGSFNYSERKLTPQEFMVFTTFNPKDFESLWRHLQPKGNLVFQELTPDVQNKLLSELAKQVQFEVGGHLINGVYVDSTSDDKHLFNGFISRILSDKDVIIASSSSSTMISKLKAVRKAIPEAWRNNPNLRYIMSVDDADTYDDELTAQTSKGVDYTQTNAKRFKGTDIEAIPEWPDGLIIATLCGMSTTTNLWAGTNLVDDANVVQIDKLTNAGELYFFKMKIKMDTNIVFGDQVVILDARTKETATLSGSVITAGKYCSSIEVTPTADTALTVTGDGVLLGARLTVVNKATDKKVTIGTVEVGAGKTVTLGYNGSAWWKVA